MNEATLLPWHEANWQQLCDALDAGRLAHGVLLLGPAGLGKRGFAEALAARLLCEQPDNVACGQCRGCHLRLTGNHPDVFRVVPDEDKNQIRVEQIRALIAQLTLASQLQGYKVVIIHPADALNVNAQNSLLKTLEEPPTATQLLLVSSRAAALAPTVRSRCQTLRFSIPPATLAREWLAQGDPAADWDGLLRIAGGAPLLALELAQHGGVDLDARLAGDIAQLLRGRADPVSLAEEWAAEDAGLRLRWMQRLVYALVRWKLTGERPELVHSSLTKSLQKVIPGSSVRSLFRYLDAVERAMALADKTVNLTLTLVPLMSVWADGARFERTAIEVP